MPVNLSVKNVPDDLAARLRERARRNHRSLQGELMAILEGAGPALNEATTRRLAASIIRPQDSVGMIREMRDTRYGGEDMGGVTIGELLEHAKASGLSTPDESTQWLRDMRDAR